MAWLLERFGFVHPGDEAMIAELKRFEKLFDLMESKSPEQKYQEAQSSHYRLKTHVVENDERRAYDS